MKAGSPDKPDLVLLHGWPRSKEVYDQAIDDLAADHFVLAFDLPAIGDFRGAPTSAETKDLADIMLGAGERAGATSIVIAGLDIGGMIAYAAERDHAPELRAQLSLTP